MQEPTPLHKQVFVRAEVAVAAFARAPASERNRFRRDIDAAVDQSAAPRA
jgi:hypothetical protein